MALRLGIDIDGVLADFRNAFRETARECLRREVASDVVGEASLTHVDIDRVWNHIARRPNWWMTLRAYEPAEIARLYALARAHRWRSRSPRHPALSRRNKAPAPSCRPE